MLRVLCIGDPHFQDRTRVRHEELIEKSVALSKQLEPNRIVLMGDILDRFKLVNQYNLHNAHRFIKLLSDIAEVYVLIGNHDRPTNDDFMSPIHPFEGISMSKNSKVHIVYQTLTVYEETLGKNFVYVPYVTNGRFQEALEYGKVDLEKAAVIFAHQEFKGSDYRGIASKEGDSWSEKSPLIISGHIHKYQRVGRNIIYVGTPIQFSQDEENGKTVSLFTFEKYKEPKEERISLGCKEFKWLNTDVKGFIEWVYSDIYYWSIKIVDLEGELKILKLSAKYKHCISLGISISLQIVSTSRSLDVATLKDLQTIDLYDSVYDRVKGDELMLKWLKNCNGI